MARDTIYFISDTHLGDGSIAERFRYEQQLLLLLDRIEKEPGAELVLLGDFMELWSASLEGILIRHAPVLEAIARITETRPVTYVVGNHDSLPWYYYLGHRLGKIRVAERFTARQGSLVALHGHQFDPLNRVSISSEGHVKAPWVRKLVQVIGFLERAGGDPTKEAIDDISDLLARAAASIEHFLPRLDEQMVHMLSTGLHATKNVLEHESPGERGYPVKESRYEEAAFSLMRRGARFVLMGHTHHPLKHTYGERCYVNTGSWVWDRYPPTYARFSDGILELLEANTHQPFLPEKT